MLGKKDQSLWTCVSNDLNISVYLKVIYLFIQLIDCQKSEKREYWYQIPKTQGCIFKLLPLLDQAFATCGSSAACGSSAPV